MSIMRFRVQLKYEIRSVMGVKYLPICLHDVIQVTAILYK